MIEVIEVREVREVREVGCFKTHIDLQWHSSLIITAASNNINANDNDDDDDDNNNNNDNDNNNNGFRRDARAQLRQHGRWQIDVAGATRGDRGQSARCVPALLRCASTATLGGAVSILSAA